MQWWHCQPIGALTEDPELLKGPLGLHLSPLSPHTVPCSSASHAATTFLPPPPHWLMETSLKCILVGLPLSLWRAMCKSHGWETYETVGFRKGTIMCCCMSGPVKTQQPTHAAFPLPQSAPLALGFQNWGGEVGTICWRIHMVEGSEPQGWAFFLWSKLTLCWHSNCPLFPWSTRGSHYIGARAMKW